MAAKNPSIPGLIRRLSPFLLPLAVLVALFLIWNYAVASSKNLLLPSPAEVFLGLLELLRKGILFDYALASLFRIVWSFLVAIVVGVPFGLAMGRLPWLYQAFNPLLQVLRPISPIAWIPLSLLWFGLSETAPMFLIFMSCVFPIVVSSLAAAQAIPPIYLCVADNFRIKGVRRFFEVIIPATLPQILSGLRVAWGVGWVVVVAAEMIVVNPRTGGLGYLINDSRSSGRYDLVVAAMIVIGLIGLLVDGLLRQLERLDIVRWGFHR